MTYPNAHLLLTVHWGHGAASVEVGQFGLRYDSTAAATQALVDACAGPVQTMWQNSVNGIPHDYVLTFLRLASIGTDGKYVPGTVAFDHNYSGGIPGGPAGGTSVYRYPLQTAQVTRLLTANARGQAHEGRIYMPPIDVPLDSGYHMPIGNCDNRSNATSAMLSALNTAMPGPLTIFSKGSKAAPTVGAKHAVTGILTDNRLDVQRRRASQQTLTLGAVFTV